MFCEMVEDLGMMGVVGRHCRPNRVSGSFAGLLAFPLGVYRAQDSPRCVPLQEYELAQAPSTAYGEDPCRLLWGVTRPIFTDLMLTVTRLSNDDP